MAKLRQVADLAYQMIIDNGITEAPIPIERIIRNNDVLMDETDLGDEISGLLIITNNTAVIAYSPNQVQQRKRFTLAHEFGHFILHKGVDEDSFFVDKDFIVKYRGNKIYSERETRQEQEANAFAASILMPKQFVFDELSKPEFKDLTELALIDALAKKFDVSVPAMTYRLSNLNILF